MAGKADFAENAFLNYVLRGVAMPTISGLYLALYTVTPTADAGTGGTEVTGGSYARQNVSRSTGAWKDPSTATQGLSDNLADIVFPTATANWGTITGVALMDAASGGNMWYFNDLTASKTVNINDVFKFLTGDLDFTES